MSYSLDSLKKRANEEIKSDEDLLILTIASGILAAFGLILSNIFVLMGAMLVAPFFNPIISLGLFIVSKDWKGVKKATSSVLFISILALLSSSVVYMIGGIWSDLSSDLGLEAGFSYFIVAFILGAVGGLLWLWPKTPTTSAGVSIAISLVPPLANISRGFFLMDQALVVNSLVLFFLNVIGIIMGVTIVFKIKTEKYN